uniref:Ovule protein n=1 Tax=Rhabditophanes sp. KR3021 TaxID=114890 RepID=A0AC35TFV0_9BILA
MQMEMKLFWMKSIMAKRHTETPNLEEKITLKRDFTSLPSMPNFKYMNLSQDGLAKPTPLVKRTRLFSTHVDFEMSSML